MEQPTSGGGYEIRNEDPEFVRNFFQDGWLGILISIGYRDLLMLYFSICSESIFATVWVVCNLCLHRSLMDLDELDQTKNATSSGANGNSSCKENRRERIRFTR